MFSSILFEQMQSHIGCICEIFLQSEFLHASSNYLHQQMQSHIGCICKICCQSEFLNVYQNCPQKLMSRIGCIWLTSCFCLLPYCCWEFQMDMCSFRSRNANCLFLFSSQLAFFDDRNFHFSIAHLFISLIREWYSHIEGIW